MYVMKKLGIRNISIAVQCLCTYELKYILFLVANHKIKK